MPALRRLVTTVEVDEDRSDPRRLSVSALLEAELDDGRRLLLLDDRGWSGSGPADVWATTTVAELEDTARTVVGPDEPAAGQTAEDVADAHWARHGATLRLHGVVVEPAELRRLPHDVVLGPRLRARLGAGPGAGPGGEQVR